MYQLPRTPPPPRPRTLFQSYPGQREASESAPLLIVGAGVLGRLAASEWRDARGDGTGEVAESGRLRPSGAAS